MKRPLIVGLAATVAVLVTAAAARIHDAPYIAFVEGRRAEATDGLRNRAGGGDRFAAFLVASNYERGVLGTRDSIAASDWYVKAARLGETRSIARYVNLTVANSHNIEQCRNALALLDVAGRSGEHGALTILGRYYETGFCTPTDLVTAARYYMGAARLDGRLKANLDSVTTRLDPATVKGLRPLPEKFDLDEDAVLAQFLAAAPSLAAGAPH
jgi:TPR repeat protein